MIQSNLTRIVETNKDDMTSSKHTLTYENQIAEA